MDKQFKLEEYQKAYRVVVVKDEKRGFMLHLLFYVVVNVGLMIFNLVSQPDYKWFIFPLIGWGFGILMHFIFSVLMIEKDLEGKEALAEKLMRSEQQNAGKEAE